MSLVFRPLHKLRKGKFTEQLLLSLYTKRELQDIFSLKKKQKQLVELKVFFS